MLAAHPQSTPLQSAIARRQQNSDSRECLLAGSFAQRGPARPRKCCVTIYGVTVCGFSLRCVGSPPAR